MRSRSYSLAILVLVAATAEVKAADVPQVEFLYSSPGGLVQVRSESQLPEDKSQIHVRVYTSCNNSWFWTTLSKVTGEQDIRCKHEYMTYSEYLSKKNETTSN